MATVTGKTSAKIDELLAVGLVSGQLDAGGQLTLQTRGGTTINAGSVSDTLVGAVINTVGRLILTRRNGTTVDAGQVASRPIDSWPIGSVYMSVSPSNPSGILQGGTWVPWGGGRVPVGVNPTEPEFDAVEEIGGAKTVTLTSDQMPSHTHENQHVHPMPHTHDPVDPTAKFLLNAPGGADNRANGSSYNAYTDFTTGQPSTPNTGQSLTPTSTATGGGQAHNNLQPYITCYMWKRTA